MGTSMAERMSRARTRPRAARTATCSRSTGPLTAARIRASASSTGRSPGSASSAQLGAGEISVLVTFPYPVAGAAARLLQQAHVGDAHASVHRLAHVVHRRQGGLHGDDRLHLHAGALAGLGGH